MTWTLSNRCSVVETIKEGERIDVTFPHRNSAMDTTALHPHEWWDLSGGGV